MIIHVQAIITSWFFGQIEKTEAFWKEGREVNKFHVGGKSKQGHEVH